MSDAAALVEAAASASEWDRSAALREARERGNDYALAADLEAALRDPDDAGRRNAARSLLAALVSGTTGSETLDRLRRLATVETDADVRVLAATALGESGNPAAREALVAALHDREPNVTAAAADALGSLGDVRAVAPLAALLSHPDPWCGAAAAVALGRLGDARALPALAAASDAARPLVGDAAVEAIGEIGDPAGLDALERAVAAGAEGALAAVGAILRATPPDPLPEWVRRVAGAQGVELRARFERSGAEDAAVLLGAAGDETGATLLVDALDSPERSGPAAAGLRLLPPDVALSALLPRLAAGGGADRAALLSALPALPDGEAARRVLPLLGDPDEEVRALAAEAVAGVEETGAGRALLERALADPRLRVGATMGLGRLPGGACLLLAELLEDPEPEVRRAAAEGIARCPDTVAAAAVGGALDREADPAVRTALVAALGATGGAAAVPRLAELAREEGALRFAAVRGLGATRAHEALPPLLAALAIGDPALEAAALRAIGELGDPEGVDAVASRMEDPSLDVRREAAVALRRLAPAAAVGRLLAALSDPDWRIRVAAARTLGRVAPRESAEALAAARDGDPDPLVRSAAAAALAGEAE